MQKRVFKLGETIVKRGEQPSSLYIISKGQCSLVYNTTAERCMVPDINMNSIKDPLKNFTFSKSKETDPKNKFKKKQVIHVAKTIRSLALPELEDCAFEKVHNFQYSKRNFRFEALEPKDDGTKKYVEHFVLKALSPGDILCSRALLSKNIGFDGSDVPGKDPEIAKARYDIVANSATLVTYELKRNNIVYIPEQLKKILLNGIKNSVDFDVLEIEKIEEKLKNWDAVKEEIYLEEISKFKLVDDADIYKKF